MPPCMRCAKVQPRAEVRRAGGGSGYFCKDKSACAARSTGTQVERTRTGRRVSNGDIGPDGRLV